MRCALVVPAWAPREIFSSGTVGSQINYWQPLGTLYVAACLRQAGHEVRFFDGGFMTHDEILAGIRQYAPAFVGLYATTFGWPRAVRTAADLKRVDPAVFTCVGGPYPIAAREACLRRDGGGVDAVVTGEGEWSVVEMVERLEHGRDLEGVAGVVFRRGDGVVANPPRQLVADLDALPFPARDLLGDACRYVPPPGTYRRRPVAVVLTSRGCDRRCLFCFQIDRERRAGVRGIRYRSVDNVLAELEACVRQGYREVKFIDDTLAADYGRAMDLARGIRARRLDLTWFASACVNQVDAPLLRAFREAGCWAILFGAESGVQRNLNTLRKGITLDQTRRAVRAAREAGLTVTTSFILGIPGESVEDALRTIDFAVELDADIANFHALTPFPGTDLWDQREQHGTVSGALGDYTYQGAAFVPRTMTREEIQALRRLAFKRFYSRPGYLARRLLGIRTLNDVRAAAKGARSLLWLWAGGAVFPGARAPAAGPSTAGGPPAGADDPARRDRAQRRPLVQRRRSAAGREVDRTL